MKRENTAADKSTYICMHHHNTPPPVLPRDMRGKEEATDAMEAWE